MCWLWFIELNHNRNLFMFQSKTCTTWSSEDKQWQLKSKQRPPIWACPWDSGEVERKSSNHSTVSSLSLLHSLQTFHVPSTNSLSMLLVWYPRTPSERIKILRKKVLLDCSKFELGEPQTIVILKTGSQP